MSKPTFKEGDRVRVKNCADVNEYIGATGTIIPNLDQQNYGFIIYDHNVKLEKYGETGFDEHELELLNVEGVPIESDIEYHQRMYPTKHRTNRYETYSSKNSSGMFKRMPSERRSWIRVF
jgi:signal peptidase I